MDLPPGSTVPPTVVAEKHATEGALGLVPHDVDDPGGEVFEDGAGELSRPAPTAPGTYDGATAAMAADRQNAHAKGLLLHVDLRPT